MDPVGVHAALDEIDVQVHEPAHLDRATERDFSIALGKVQVTKRQFRPRDVDRIEDPAPRGKVLDVLVPAVLTRRGRPGPPLVGPFVLSPRRRPGTCARRARAQGPASSTVPWGWRKTHRAHFGS